jgi:hypothetical protein
MILIADSFSFLPKVPLTSLYESSTSKPVEAQPRTSLIQIGATSEKISSIYSNVQQDNSVKGERTPARQIIEPESYDFSHLLLSPARAVNIQNFESRSPALSRNNSLRIKRDDTSSAVAKERKLSTGTRQLRDHELTFFGVSSPKPMTNSTTDSKFTKSSFTTINSTASSSASLTTHSHATTLRPLASTVIVNHQSQEHNKPDLIMHHTHQKSETSTPELTSSEKKLLIETLDSCIDETKNLEPMYENLYQKTKYDRKSDLARDEKILNELTRAADEIMNVSRAEACVWSLALLIKFLLPPPVADMQGDVPR